MKTWQHEGPGAMKIPAARVSSAEIPLAPGRRIGIHNETSARAGGRNGDARRSRKDFIMTGWVILVDQPKDFPNADTPHKVITTSDYLVRPRLFENGRPKLLNLSRSYA